ncbi:hypothetical protein GCM10020367_34080 [Streptomyces sannanensis]|uniref:TIGR04222 domain-containing membrane protein n=2 Tax=Streptomyces sannanensis TaxID=285536 RepID=A0ABP6SD25_9ACTN
MAVILRKALDFLKCALRYVPHGDPPVTEQRGMKIMGDAPVAVVLVVLGAVCLVGAVLRVASWFSGGGDGTSSSGGSWWAGDGGSSSSSSSCSSSSCGGGCGGGGD